MRRRWDPYHYDYVSRATLIRQVKRFNKLFSTHQRVQDRLDEHKKPDMLTMILDQTRTLRNLSKTLRDMYNVMRFSICASGSLISHSDHVNFTSRRVFRRLIWSLSLLYQTSLRRLLITIIAKAITIATTTKMTTITTMRTMTMMTERTRLSSTRSAPSSRLSPTGPPLPRRLSSPPSSGSPQLGLESWRNWMWMSLFRGLMRTTRRTRIRIITRGIERMRTR